MVTWKDHYVERQRRRDEMASARQHRVLVEPKGGSHSRADVGRSLMAFFGSWLQRLVGSLRREEGARQRSAL